jgi:hypothetical protein
MAAYFVAVFAMLFSASSALTLIHFVSRLDPPEPNVPAKSPKVEAAAA